MVVSATSPKIEYSAPIERAPPPVTKTSKSSWGKLFILKREPDRLDAEAFNSKAALSVDFTMIASPDREISLSAVLKPNAFVGLEKVRL